jgi:dienelactone hydrolase
VTSIVSRLAALLAAALLPCVALAERVGFDNGRTRIAAHWLPAGRDGARPAVVALHGCGGLYRRDGVTLQERYTDYAVRLNAAGFHVVLPDSFGSRGSGPTCTLRAGERRITLDTRRGDVLAALAWLRQRPDVDPKRIVLLGWSNGASTLLTALNSARPKPADVAGAVAFYPGCSQMLKRPYTAAAPLLMLLGAIDDWTPPAPCERLAARVRQAQPSLDLVLKVYPDSGHGFDGRGPVRFRSDVASGVSPAGVNVGGNPQARSEALAEMDRFLAQLLQ